MTEEVHEEARAKDAHGQLNDPDHQRERDRQLHGERHLAVRQGTDPTRHEQGHHRHRPDREETTRTQECVDRHGEEPGVKTHFDRKLGEQRVSHRLGHKHRGDDDPRDDVRAEIATAVGTQPLGEHPPAWSVRGACSTRRFHFSEAYPRRSRPPLR